MRKAVIVFSVLLLMSAEAFSQASPKGSMCKVIYSHLPLDYYINRAGKNPAFHVMPVEFRLAIYGKQALFYYMPGETEILGKKQRKGARLINHANFYDFDRQLVFHEVVQEHPPGYKVLIRDSLRVTKAWKLVDVHKTILGYDCRKAVCIGEKQDSTIAWYTDQLPLQAGFGKYYGLPGLVLEAFDQEQGEHFIARKIKWSNKELHFPTGFPEYSPGEWKKITGDNPVNYHKRKVNTKKQAAD